MKFRWFRSSSWFWTQVIMPLWCHMASMVIITSEHDDDINCSALLVSGHLCGEFTGHRWIPRKNASDAELWCFLWSVPGWVNNREAGDLRRHLAHYEVIVMKSTKPLLIPLLHVSLVRPLAWSQKHIWTKLNTIVGFDVWNAMEKLYFWNDQYLVQILS